MMRSITDTMKIRKIFNLKKEKLLKNLIASLSMTRIDGQLTRQRIGLGQGVVETVPRFSFVFQLNYEKEN